MIPNRSCRVEGYQVILLLWSRGFEETQRPGGTY